MIVLMTLLLALLPIQAQDTDLCAVDVPSVVVWNDTGTEFAIGSCSGIYRYDAATMTLIERIERQVQWHMAYQPGGNLLAFGESYGLILWDLNAGEVYTRLNGIGVFSWDETGEHLAFTSLSRDRLSIVNVEPLDVIHVLDAPQRLVLQIDWEAENAIRFVDNFELFTWYLDSDQITRYTLPFHVGWGWGDYNNAFWFDEAVMIFPGVGGNDSTIGVWRYRQGDWSVTDFREGGIFSWSFGAHPEDDIFAIGSMRDVYLFDATTIELLETYPVDNLEGVPLPTCTDDALDESQLFDIVAWHPDGESLLVVSPCRMALLPMDTPAD